MGDTTLIAVLSFVGTLIGTLGGILASNKLVNYRLKQLESKVEKHNNLVERMYKVEERSKSNTYRLNELRDEMNGAGG